MKRRLDASLTFGGAIVLALALLVLVSLFYTPYPPARQDIGGRLAPPSTTHLLGTDHLGRDTLSRLMEGAQNSLSVAVFAVAFASVVGTALGMIAGYFGGWADEVLMRFVDFVMGFPVVLLAILVIAAFGPGLRNSLIAIAVATVPSFARLVRGTLLSLREADFVLAARAGGAGNLRVLAAHLLPNLSSYLLVQVTISLGTALLADAGLSYLGLGVQPPHASWGRMVYEARGFLALDVWPAIFPGLAIATAILGFNLLGDGLRDRFDPRVAGRVRGTRRRPQPGSSRSSRG
jgi:peptide/nickel transport system permease protein